MAKARGVGGIALGAVGNFGTLTELNRELGQAVRVSICPPVFDRDGTSPDPAEVAQSLHEDGRTRAHSAKCSTIGSGSDHARPRCAGGNADQHDEPAR